MDLKEPLNLDRVLGKTKNLIAMIGIELEGGWTSLPSGTQVIRDGSVRGLRPPPGVTPVEVGLGGRGISRAMIEQHAANIRRPNEGPANVLLRAERELTAQLATQPIMQIGEIPSPVMPPSELEPWMRRYYPQSVNETCGMHMHMSFEKALLYQRLMVPAYPATIRAYVTLWAKEQKLPKDHPLWPRLKGDSVYCQHQFWPDHQVRMREKDHDQRREGHRYTDISYPYSRTGTIECRLLPMMETADLGISALKRVIDITNAFLLQGKYREPSFVSKTEGADPINEVKRVSIPEQRRSGEIR